MTPLLCALRGWMPLVLPPAINGLVPQLRLRYSSRMSVLAVTGLCLAMSSVPAYYMWVIPDAPMSERELRQQQVKAKELEQLPPDKPARVNSTANVRFSGPAVATGDYRKVCLACSIQWKELGFYNCGGSSGGGGQLP